MVAVVVLDQLAKHVIVNRYALGDQTELFGSVRIIRVANRGMAFGKGRGFGGVAIVASALIGVLVVVGWREARRPHGHASRLSALVFGAVLGGALGNLCDRLFRAPGAGRGAVVDFIDLGPWPVFNIADAALTLGCLYFAVRGLRAGPGPAAAPPVPGERPARRPPPSRTAS